MSKIFVINVGSTTTKVAYYVDRVCVVKANLEHDVRELLAFGDLMNQKDFRKQKIQDFMSEKNIQLNELDAITSRGGHTHPIEGGVYRISPLMLEEISSGKFGRHACDVGPGIAFEMTQGEKSVPLVVDPPVTDEFGPLARYSGHPLMPRRSKFHALNHKATAKRYAKENGLNYGELRLVTVHMGGGTSIAAHQLGKITDANNGIEGEGPFSTNRTGGLTAQFLADLCFSGKYTPKEVAKMINGEGGLVAYLNESDARKCEDRAVGDPYADEVMQAMIYQVAKEVGAYACVLDGNIDAILLTGGIANSKKLMDMLIEQIGFLGKVVLYPGENEMEALAFGADDGLNGVEPIKLI